MLLIKDTIHKFTPGIIDTDFVPRKEYHGAKVLKRTEMIEKYICSITVLI